MVIEAARRKFTVDEYQRLAETGILLEDDPVELIEGEIILMSAAGRKHKTCVYVFWQED